MDEDECPEAPGEMRTPMIDAARALATLEPVYKAISEKAGAIPDKDFLESLVIPMLDDDSIDGDLLVNRYLDFCEKKDPKEVEVEGLSLLMKIACAYAVQAAKAEGIEKDGAHTDRAWVYAADAFYWTGAVVGAWHTKQDAPMSVADLARRGTDAKHAKNRIYREQIIAYYRQGSYRSKNDAAAKIAGTKVPLSYQVVRNHLKGI